MHPKALT